MADIRLEFPRLDDNNYHVWRIHMQSKLEVNDLWEPVQAEKLPTDDTVLHAKDRRAKGVIALAVSEQYLQKVHECKTSKAAWDMLADIYATRSAARQQLLRQELNTMRKGRNESLTQYVARVETIMGQLSAAGDATAEGTAVQCMMAGLPSEYAVSYTHLTLPTKA